MVLAVVNRHAPLELMALPPLPTVAELLADPQRVVDLPPEAAQSLLFQITALVPALATRVVANGGSHAAERLLDVDEAAAKLGQSTQWLYRRAKKLPFTIKQGASKTSSLRFSERGIDEYIRAQSRQNGGARRT